MPKLTKINKYLSVINNSIDLRENSYKHYTVSFEKKSDDIYNWFHPTNNYPNYVISKIMNGTTLSSILNEDLIYKTGSGFNADNSDFLDYINNETLSMQDEKFKDLFKRSNNDFTTLGNVFVEIIINEKGELLWQNIIQPQKCRLTKKGSVWISADWKNFNSKKSNKLPLYPNFKGFTRFGQKYYKSICHIKNMENGFDHYGLNANMVEAINVLNETEHRRNNWRLSQIKNSFKKDFFAISDFPMNVSEKEKLDLAFKKKSGDDNAGGVETIEGEGLTLVPAQGDFDFDFSKDDTSDQLFLKFGFPKSLIGIKSGAAFSVDQVESDYDQYLPKVTEQQIIFINQFKEIFKQHTNYNTDGWAVINNTPAVVLQQNIQTMMPYMNEEQQGLVVDKFLKENGFDIK